MTREKEGIQMNAITIGSTGAVGRDLFQVLAEDDAYERVDVLVRRAPQLPEAHAEKFHVHFIDFEQPETWKGLVQGDVLFSSLGTSKKQAGGKKPQWRVDHDYQLAAAAAARENGVPQMVAVSSLGAAPASSFFYLRMKGEVENDLAALGFPALTILRPPSLIRHPAKRFTETLSVKVLQACNTFGFLKSMKPMRTMDVARAMAHLAKRGGQGTEIVSGQDILSFA